MHPEFDPICDDFEAALQRGENPAPEEYLLRVVAERRSDLLVLLLEIQLERLISQNLIPSERSYQKRFRDYPRAVDRAFRKINERFPEKRDALRWGQRHLAPEDRSEHAESSLTFSQNYPATVLKSGVNIAGLQDDSDKEDHAPVVRLKVVDGPNSGQELVFRDHRTCIIGRAADADLRLSPNREFSRYHCRLEINPPIVAVTDLDSTNGTRVNGVRVATAVLASGDHVLVGDTAFTVTIHVPEHTPVGPEATLIGPVWAAGETPDEAELSDSFQHEAPKLPGYVIDREIGHGNMGTVYKARRIATNERVAIKTILPQATADPRSMERFRREGSIILRLRHKRIIRTYDFCIPDDAPPYLVMEFIDQANIRGILEAARPTERIRMACGVIVRVLEALQYAHDREIVHRDVKPGNMLVFYSGRKLQVKLADFGLAKNYIDAGFNDCSRSDEICGTVAYMSPEQIKNCRYSKPTVDIYSAGVCLYNLISGRVPFESENHATQISRILEGTPVPITQHVPDLPHRLVEIIGKATSRDISFRYATAEEMRQELLPFSKRHTKDSAAEP
ncbi:MAG: protein kinase [Planctomycetaceae bacterium]|nr:protein kinase [Planctomycetaceae bacterium]